METYTKLVGDPEQDHHPHSLGIPIEWKQLEDCVEVIVVV